MRARHAAVAVMLALAATPAAAKRAAPPSFAEPGDIIAAEGNFAHISAEKGLKAAIRATAASDAQIFAPLLRRVSDYVSRPGNLGFPAPWHTTQVWMSCDGSVAVTHGRSQQGAGPALGWYITVWKRQKGGGYKWVLEQGGALNAAPAMKSDMPESDMIAASVADCPARRPRGAAAQPPAPVPPAPVRGKALPADYSSGHAEDGTLDWATTISADGGRSFTLQIKRDGSLHEVLRTAAAPPGG